MSSRLLKAGSDQIQVVDWTGTGASAGAQPGTYPVAGQTPPAPAADRTATQELEARIAALQRETQQKEQAALQQGLQQGEAKARQQLAAQVEALLQRLARSVEEISGLRQRYRREAEQDVVKLAIAIARRVVHREITIDPEALVGVVKAALEKIDVRELHRLRLHPDQAASLQQQIAKMGLPRRVEVVADATLERGAAILETTHGSLDASVETQLAEIERGFTDLVRHSQ